MKSRIQRRKDIASKQKQYTEEELEAMEEEIPEWKRGAVAVSDIKIEEDKGGLLRRAGRSIGNKIGETKLGHILR